MQPLAMLPVVAGSSDVAMEVVDGSAESVDAVVIDDDATLQKSLFQCGDVSESIVELREQLN